MRVSRKGATQSREEGLLICRRIMLDMVKPGEDHCGFAVIFDLFGVLERPLDSSEKRLLKRPLDDDDEGSPFSGINDAFHEF